MRKKHAPTLAGLILSLAIILLIISPFSDKLDAYISFGGPMGMWVSGLMLFLYCFLFGVAIALMSAGGQAHGFRVKKPHLIIGCAVLIYWILMLAFDYLGFVRDIAPFSGVAFDPLGLRYGGTGRYGSLPISLVTTAGGFFLFYGLYGDKTSR